MRGYLVVSLGVAACGSPQAPPPVVGAHAPVPVAVAADAAIVDATPPVYTGLWSPFPGCVEADTKARLADVEDLWQRHRPDARAFGTDLTALLAKPCLAHVAPAVASFDGVDQAWPGLIEALRDATHGFKITEGRRLLVIPPEPMRPLAADVARDIAPFVCATGTKDCGRAGSYILRAHAAFDAVAEVELGRLRVSPAGRDTPGILPRTPPEIPVEWCYETAPNGYVPDLYVEWATCVAKLTPRTYRFARTDLRAPVKGWLVLRGRRGHYISQDEIRAYDLATGTAYIISGESGTPAAVDTAAGTVGVDQLREVAFMLVAQRALVELRDTMMYAQVPDSLALTLEPSLNETRGKSTWMSTAQTDIAYSFVQGSADRFGTFTWPYSASWVENHIVKLIRVMEAGFVPGCAPAKLPTRAALFRAEGRLKYENDPTFPTGREYAALESKVDGMRKLACPRAR